MTQRQEKVGFLGRLGPEAVVTLGIACVAVLVATVSFKTHVQDFEIASQEKIADLRARVASLEEREREDQTLLARVDGSVAHVREDVAALKKQISIILERLPKPQ